MKKRYASSAVTKVLVDAAVHRLQHNRKPLTSTFGCTMVAYRMSHLPTSCKPVGKTDYVIAALLHLGIASHTIVLSCRQGANGIKRVGFHHSNGRLRM